MEFSYSMSERLAGVKVMVWFAGWRLLEKKGLIEGTGSAALWWA